MSENIKNSIRALLSETIDYAGLFPPSQLSMSEAVQNYAEYLKSEQAWMLGRFIVPAANLGKFIIQFEKVFDDEKPWRLSAVISQNAPRNLRKISRFNEANKNRAIIEAVEIKAHSAEEIKQTARLLPENPTVYFEIPSSIVLTDLITAVALSKTRAKIRTGGITQEAFPPVDEIVRFMRVCMAANVPFKATAGLHHPLRGFKPLTYAENSPKGTMNGFLSLFLTAVFLRQNLNYTFVHELMNETDAGSFTFEDESISWKNHTITTREIEIARQKCAVSFGSCSFTEPITDLREIGIL